jgi:hypothetical protein
MAGLWLGNMPSGDAMPSAPPPELKRAALAIYISSVAVDGLLGTRVKSMTPVRPQCVLPQAIGRT